jgi:hypothetical protein
MLRIVSPAMMLILLAACSALAQDDLSASATCNYDQDKQLVVQYQHVTFNLKKPLQQQIPFGKPWAPGGKTMTLFTNTAVQVGSHQLAIGAYTIFIIPNAKQWTLIVSSSTDTSGAYDEQKDLVRVPMESGELPSPQPDLAVGFEHIAAGQCNLRMDLDKAGHFASFLEK